MANQDEDGRMDMTDFIIIAIIIVAVGLGIRSTMKHFKGQGGCCGGSSYKTKRKKLPHVLYKKLIYVDGMHCDHCKNRVEDDVNDIANVAAIANLKKGELTVSYADTVDDELIKARIERAGYSVTKIEQISLKGDCK